MSRQLTERVSAYMKKLHMVQPGEKVLVGLSGGADSVCLFLVLLALREPLGFSVEAVHVNHCLRENATKDEHFVRTLCKEKGVVLHTYSVDVRARAEKEGLSTEEAGRDARYECFSDAMMQSGASKVAVAHHKNDQAETILFQLGRGSGVRGLAGIRPVREQVIRPLLCLGREQMEQYLAECGQSYVTDETNASMQYSRNRVRHEVLPVLEEVCPGAVEHIASAGERMLEVSDYLQGQISSALHSCVDLSGHKTGCVRLFCDVFSKLHRYLQKEVIRECIFMLGESKKDISQVHVEAVLGLVDLQVGKKVDLPYEIEVQKSYNVLIFNKKKEEKPDGESTEKFCKKLSDELTETGTEVQLPDGKKMVLRTFTYHPGDEIPTKTYTKWLDYDKIEGPIEIRTPRDEDFFYFNHKNKKYVKDYMVNEKIPMTERGKAILVASGSHMLYFVGIRISSGALVDETTRKILEITVAGG